MAAQRSGLTQALALTIMDDEILTDFSRNTPLETEMANAVGELAIEFGRLEYNVAELVSASFGRMDLASQYSIVAVLSFRQKLDIVGSLAPSRIADKQALASVQACIRQLSEFEEKRNTLLHAFVGIDFDTPDKDHYLLRTRPHRIKGFIQSRKPVDPQTVKDLTAQIREFRNMFGPEGALYHSAHQMYEASAHLNLPPR